jgi:hypothetical protein
MRNLGLKCKNIFTPIKHVFLYKQARAVNNSYF